MTSDFATKVPTCFCLYQALYGLMGRMDGAAGRLLPVRQKSKFGFQTITSCLGVVMSE